MHARYCLSVAILLTLCLLFGCRGEQRLPLGKVTGTVTYRGEPLAKARIAFHNPDGKTAVGEVIDGVIQNVATYAAPDDGAPQGTLVVTLHPLLDPRGFHPSAVIISGNKLPKLLFPPRYSNPDTTDLLAEIHAGRNELFFDLTD